MITLSPEKKQIVLIAGPSSSGKTTFAHRLEIQLRVNGLRPVTISLDDYFVNREKTPLDENGEFDFEALNAVDVPLFNEHLASLISGKEVEIPLFNFPNGCREKVGRKMKIEDDQVIIIEGIHGLNEKLNETISKDKKFKIYISAITSMNIDNHNRIPTTDARIIRRIVRDFQFRGSSAVSTIKRWPSVRRGEEKNIFPFQEEADVMFNSAMVYELGVLKKFAEPLLAEVDSSKPEYSEAKRLIEFLSYFLPIESKEIPANSIIREFIGGSCFYC
jgi:uridine kinase